MKEKTIEINYLSCREEELPKPDRELVEAAKEMTFSSYAPYSKFCVGAAIRLENGDIIRGSNQENVAYPSGLCAERTACFQASALHPGMPLRQIAIAARNVGSFLEANPDADPSMAPFQDTPISPCGACRQALLEYEHLYGAIQVILYGADETYVLPSIASLMPFSFTEF